MSSHDALGSLVPARRFGPWALNLDPGERLARLRSLRAIVRLLTGPRGVALDDLLRQAEADENVLVPAADALDALAPRDMRRVLSTYASLVRPLAPARATKSASTRARAWAWPARPVVPWPWAAVA
jgi:hypothetical protein